MALQTFKNAQYYARPDGEDYYGKMLATHRYMLAGAVPFAYMDIIMVNKPKGVFPTIRRFFYWTAPAAAMASAFTTTTYLSTRIRGKDDFVNYMFGSCAAGAIVGAWRQSVVGGASACIFFSIAAAVKRISLHEGWEFFPKEGFEKRVRGFAVPSRWDLTLTTETPVEERGYITQHDK